MQPKPQINVRSFSKVIVVVGSNNGASAETANWAVKQSEPRIIKSSSRDVKVEDGLRIDLNRVNKMLRGKLEVNMASTKPSERLETA